MKKHLSIATPDEDVEGQIDRLNFAVQKLVQGIQLSAQTPRNPSQLSIFHYDWQDDELPDDESRDGHISLDIESRVEGILIQLDRIQMINEDFWAEASRRETNIQFYDHEAYVVKLEKENMELRSKSLATRNEFTLNLRKNPNLEIEKKNFEDKLQQLDKLNEIYQRKNSQNIKVQESLRVKEKWLDQKERELRNSWQIFEKTKSDWELSKSNQGSIGYYKIPNNSTRNISNFSSDIKHEAPSPAPPETPISRERAMKILQSELTESETILKSLTNSNDQSKLIIKIDQIKNKLATLRGQKALHDSVNSSRLITSMMKTMEKEVSYEENKRKQQIERFSRKSISLSKSPFDCKKLENFSTSEKEIQSEFSKKCIPKTNSSQLPADERQLLAFKKELLLKKEKDIAQREILLQETWMKIPGSKELIEIVNLALSKLTEQKNELDNEREAYEQEKIEMLKLRDKFMKKATR